MKNIFFICMFGLLAFAAAATKTKTFPVKIMTTPTATNVKILFATRCTAKI